MEISGGTKFLNRDEIIKKADLKQGMTVACLGCGNLGHFILPSASLVGRDGIAYAVDIQPSVLDSVRHLATLQTLTNLKTVRANLENMGSTAIPVGSVDVAYLVNVLFQNKKHQEVIAEAARLLKKGGRLIVADWKKVGVPFGPSVNLRLDPDQVISYASKANLRLVLQTEFGQYFWGLIFEKI